jgi:hypothetical protein
MLYFAHGFEILFGTPAEICYAHHQIFFYIKKTGKQQRTTNSTYYINHALYKYTMHVTCQLQSGAVDGFCCHSRYRFH